MAAAHCAVRFSAGLEALAAAQAPARLVALAVETEIAARKKHIAIGASGPCPARPHGDTPWAGASNDVPPGFSPLHELLGRAFPRRALAAPAVTRRLWPPGAPYALARPPAPGPVRQRLRARSNGRVRVLFSSPPDFSPAGPRRNCRPP